MIVLPVNTDAPIYHFPWVTISLIGVNIAAFVASFMTIMEAGPDEVTWVHNSILEFGKINPVQWITSVFLHGGFFHILANMFFLWGFGLVVEGKLGWWRYLGLYLGIAAAAGLIEQLMMLGYRGDVPGALGASGVIFGLMAMSLVWAPKNDMTIFMLIFYHATVFEASILSFCGFYLCIQFVFFALDGFSMGSALLHLIGASLGLGVGIVMLKRNWVDCEGWDLFNVINNTHGRRDEYDEFRYRDAAFQASRIATPEVEEKRPAGEKGSGAALDPRIRIRKYIEAGDTISALGEYDKLIAFHPTSRLDPEMLAALADGAYREKSWDDAVPLMRQYLERASEGDPATAVRLRLKLAKILIDISHRPAEGLALLGGIDPATLPPKPAAAFRDLLKRAEAAARAAGKPGGGKASSRGTPAG